MKKNLNKNTNVNDNNNYNKFCCFFVEIISYLNTIKFRFYLNKIKFPFFFINFYKY